MKTESAKSEPERSVTFTLHLAEAFLLVQAFHFYAKNQPRKFDCGPDDMRELISVLKGAMREADPENAKFYFDDMGLLKPQPATNPAVREVHHHHYHPIPRVQPVRMIG